MVGESLFSQIASAVVATPVAIGLTALGAAMTVAQWVFAGVTGLLPDLRPGRPRHNAARVREQLRAAHRAARESGVLWSQVSDIERTP